MRPKIPLERFEVFADGRAHPAGLALSADERTLYLVQSTKDNLLAAPLNGVAKAGRPRLHANKLCRVPDGDQR